MGSTKGKYPKCSERLRRFGPTVYIPRHVYEGAIFTRQLLGQSPVPSEHRTNHEQRTVPQPPESR